MFDLFVWHYQPHKLGTFSSLSLAEQTRGRILEINPEQKVWIDPVWCHDSVDAAVRKYKSLKEDLLDA